MIDLAITKDDVVDMFHYQFGCVCWFAIAFTIPLWIVPYVIIRLFKMIWRNGK